jgi:hypothetical protein
MESSGGRVRPKQVKAVMTPRNPKAGHLFDSRADAELVAEKLNAKETKIKRGAHGLHQASRRNTEVHSSSRSSTPARPVRGGAEGCRRTAEQAAGGRHEPRAGREVHADGGPVVPRRGASPVGALAGRSGRGGRVPFASPARARPTCSVCAVS